MCLAPPRCTCFPPLAGILPPPPHSQRQTVPADTLDNLLAPPPTPPGWVSPPTPDRPYPIDLLKTDAEGHDGPALAAAPATLRRARLVLWECHADMVAVGGSHAAVAATLAAAGFEVYKLGPTTAVRFDGASYFPALDARAHMGWHNCLGVRGGDPLRAALLRRLNRLPECVAAYGGGGG